MIGHALAAGEQRAGLQADAAFFKVFHRHARRLVLVKHAHVCRIAMGIADDHGYPPQKSK
jgi:hypothetical protein